MEISINNLHNKLESYANTNEKIFMSLAVNGLMTGHCFKIKSASLHSDSLRICGGSEGSMAHFVVPVPEGTIVTEYRDDYDEKTFCIHNNNTGIECHISLESAA